MTEEEGIVIGLTGGLYSVYAGKKTLSCRARGAFRNQQISPVVGDRVSVRFEEEQKNAVITQIRERKNLLIRPPLANLDTLFLVSAARDPEPDLTLLDKLSAIAVNSAIHAVFVFTKSELDPDQADRLVSLYRGAGFDAFRVTRENEKEARDLLLPAISGSVCALAGASGVGKSTLIHTLFPTLFPEAGEISRRSGRGRHTTRASSLYPIPELSQQGAPVFVADTPGFSFLDFEKFLFMDLEDLPFAFPEFQPYLTKCRYTKCSHRTEDGCAVLDATRAGRIAESRHKSYAALYEQLLPIKKWDEKRKTRR